MILTILVVRYAIRFGIHKTMHSLASVSVSVSIFISRCCLPTYLPSTRRIVPPGSSRAAAAQAGYLFLFAVQVHRLSFSLLQCTHRSPPHCHLHPLHVQYLLCLLSLSLDILYRSRHTACSIVISRLSFIMSLPASVSISLSFSLSLSISLYISASVDHPSPPHIVLLPLASVSPCYC